MTAKDQEVIAWLAERYPGPVAIRALWLWAGGREVDLVYVDDPFGQWQQLWARIQDADGTDVTPVSLVRQALWDYPGNQTLLATLDRCLSKPAGPARESLQLLSLRLEKLAPGFDSGSLWGALVAVGPLAVEDVFTAAAPVFQGCLAAREGDGAPAEEGAPPEAPPGEAPRRVLEKQLDKLIAVGAGAADQPALVAAMGAFMEGLPAAAGTDADNLLPPLAKELQTVLTPPPPDVATLKQQVLPVIERIHAVAVESEKPLIRPAVIGLDNQAETLSALLDGKPPLSIAAVAEGCRQALWATTGGESPGPC